MPWQQQEYLLNKGYPSHPKEWAKLRWFRLTNVECDVISRNAVINGKTFPMYSGFLSAIKIDEMAEVML